MEKEIWKDIPGFEGEYQASNLGRVKSLKWNKEKILKTTLHHSGYYKVVLKKEGKKEMISVHQIVYFAFYGVRSCRKYVINHKDQNPKNCKLDNLELVTHRKNTSIERTKKSGLPTGVYVSANSKRKTRYLSRIYVDGIRKSLGSFNTPEEASIAYQNALRNIK